MNKKTARRKRDLKTKLLAAVAMLLVSSLMMVTTTYAWFTLSTAPEVTGITTAVGANGNLEMALLPLNGNDDRRDNNYGITSGTGDSMAVQTAQEANITWGNLVDLSNFYGLEGITLYPSQLNATGNQISDAAILMTPTYGADGRIAQLLANTYAGIYQDGKAVQTVDVNGTQVSNPAGVRLLGTVSGMSDRQLEFRNAISAAGASANAAKTAARNALEANGNALGNIAIKNATTGDTAVYTAEDVAALTAMVEGLDTALDNVEASLRQYIYAYQISVVADEAQYATLKANIVGTQEAPAKSFAELTSVIPGNVTAAVTKLTASRAAVAAADQALQAVGTDYTWTKISKAITPLININQLTVNGTSINDSSLKSKLIGAVMRGEGLVLSMPSESGVFADIADFAGNYSATIQIPASAAKDQLGMSDEELEGLYITASMVTSGIEPTYLTTAKTEANKNSIASENAATQALSDFYGYVIDLAFRTNAANSYLQLQTNAVDRVSDETGAENTMGGGATMTFASQDTANGFFEEEMLNLMKHIRIVFFDPANENTILGYGVMDSDNAQTLGSGEVSVPLKFATVAEPEDEDDYSDSIMALEQNKAHRLSVLVYLDGTTITNKDVAIGAAKSMMGKLNLQFSSSADLEPMKYTDFEDLDGNSPAPTPSTPVVTTLNNVKLGGAAQTAYKVDNRLVVVMDKQEDAQVTINYAGTEVPAEFATVGTYTGYVVSIPDEAQITADTAITVTVTPATP